MAKTERDYQNEINEWLEQNEDVQNKINEHLEIIEDLKQEIKDNIKYINKLKAEAKSKGFKVREEIIEDVEERALKTEQDYQDEIDKLDKELSKQIKFREDCLRTIKGNEKTKKKVEKELQDLTDDNADSSKIKKKKDELEQIEENTTNLYNMLNKTRQQIEKLSDKLDDLKTEAKKNGFKVRTEESDFESRKNEILAQYEERAPKVTVKLNYQKSIDRYVNLYWEVRDLQRELDEEYAKESKRLEKLAQQWLTKIKETEKEAKKNGQTVKVDI